MSIKNKKGWLKIVEAFIGIIMITGVVLTMMSNQGVNDSSVQQETTKLEKFILDRIVSDPTLRSQILSEDISGVNKVLEGAVPAGMNYYAKICNYDEVCSSDMIIPCDVYTQEALVSSNLTYYDPANVKIIKVFFYSCELAEGTCPSACTEGVSRLACIDSSHVGNYSCIKNSSNCFYENVTVKETCTGSATCQNGACVTPSPIFGKVSLTFSNTVYSWDTSVSRHKYTSTRTFTESNGVGINLTQGQLCYLDGTCDTKGTVNYRINANNNLVISDKYTRTSYPNDKFILTYWGKDDNGNAVNVTQQLCVNGTTFTENCA